MWKKRVLDFFTVAHAAYIALAAVGVPAALKYGRELVMWLLKWRKRKKERDISAAVKQLQNRAKEFLRKPNGNAIQSKTFWASVLSVPSLVDEALRRTARPLYPGLGTEQQEFWEVDVGQNMASDAPQSKIRRG